MTASDLAPEQVTDAVEGFARFSMNTAQDLYRVMQEVDQLRQEVADLRAQPIHRPLLNKREAAEYLSMSVSALEKLMAAGCVPVVRLTGPNSWPRFRVSDLDTWIESKVGSHDE